MKDKKIAILWFWKEGQSTLDFLQKIWAKDVTVFDKDVTLEKEPWIKYSLWETYLDSLGYYEVIIKSPWISPYNDKIAPYIDRITSQTEIFYSNYTWKVISVTATKWKSTTATLIYKTLQKAWYDVKLVWNIGHPVLSEIDINRQYDFVVYELSSYMLENLNKKDQISILWNIYPDHLDRHDWFENYSNTKKNVVRWSKYSIVRDFVWMHSDHIKSFWDTWDYTYKNWNFYVRWEKVFTNEWFKLKWEHNMMNVASVMWVCDLLKLDFAPLIDIAKEFSGLPHRMENVWTFNGIMFIDDAISTTPESTIEAIKTYKTKIWTIFLWGLDRGYEYNTLVKELDKYEIKNIVLFPETWKKIKDLLSVEDYNIIETKCMKTWVAFAFKHTKEGEIALLSTAAPSYNLWKNYIAQWDDFKDQIRNYQNENLLTRIINFFKKLTKW